MSKKQIIFLFWLLIALSVSTIWGQIPHTISYQGVLTDLKGKPVADGTYNLTFKLYLTATGNELLWSEKQTLTLTAGIFNVILGKVTPLNLPFNVPYWLGITVDTGDELTPRIELTAAAYSLNANSVADSVIQSNKIAKGTVVRSVNNLTDHLTLKAGPNVTITSDQHTITISAIGGDGMGGNGTTDYLAKFTAPKTLGNSLFFENNGGIGLGTLTPDKNTMLTVEGTKERPNGLLAIGHFGSTAVRPAGIYAGLVSSSEALTGAGIYSKVLASQNPNVGYLYGAQLNAVADQKKLCRGASIGLEGNQIDANDFALELLAVDPGYALFCRDDGKAYFGGNVGIGVLSPKQRLEVDGTILTSGFKMPTGAVNNYVLTSDANGVGSWQPVIAPTIGWTVAGNNMYSAVSGNVGIGTNNPSHKFHVVAPEAVGLFESSANLAYLRLMTNEGMNNRVEFKNMPGGNLGLWTAGAGDVLNITRAGNVGIGTLTPSQKLDVAGTAQMTGFKMPTGAAENYVLTADASGVGTWKPVIAPTNGWTVAGNNMYSAVSGNIGIGTSTPGFKLDVIGSSQITAKGDDAVILALNCDRPFAFHQRGQGSEAGLDLRPNVDMKLISISAADKKILGGFYDGSPDRVYFVPNEGNVGIGTTNPAQKLDIAGTAQMTGFKMPTGAANNYVLTSDASGVGTWKPVTSPTIGWTVAGNNMYSNVSGNVGIGTNNPSHKFHVVAQEAVGLFESSANLAYLRLMTNEGMNNRVELKNMPGGNLGLWTAGAGDVLNITRNGNVGIGTMSPGAKFHAVGEYIRFEGTSASAPNCPEIQIRETNSNSFWAMIKRGSAWSPEQNQLLFAFYNGSTWFQNMNLKTNKDVVFHGNVGVGTTNPQAALDVKGDIKLQDGSLYATASVEKLKIIRGTVNQNGSIAVGQGFSVIKRGTGRYEITFTTPFTSRPTVVVTQNSGNDNWGAWDKNTLENATIIAVRNTGFQVVTGASGGNQQDRMFEFIVAGPR